MKTKLFLIITFFILVNIDAQTLKSEYLFTNGTLNNSGINTNPLDQIGTSLLPITGIENSVNGGIELNSDVLEGPSYVSTTNKEHSVSFWIKTSDVSTTEKDIINHNGSGVNDAGWRFTLQNGNLNSWMRFYDSGRQTYNQETALTNTFDNIADGQWHHITLTIETVVFYTGINGNQAKSTYKLYIDRTLVLNNYIQRLAVGGITQVPNFKLQIGENHTTTTSNYNDQIDNIKYYDGLLDINDINNLYLELFDPNQITRAYVDINATGNNDGSSWVDAFTNLNDGITAAELSIEKAVWVAEGVYSPDVTDRTKSFTLSEGVKLYGGFNGTETSISERDWKTNETILSGDLNGDDASTIAYNEATRSDNSYRVVLINGNNSLIDGVTISGGHGMHASTAGYQKGAGIYKSSLANSIDIKNCTIKNNVAKTATGIYAEFDLDSNVNISKCTFDNNLGRHSAAYFFRSNGNTTNVSIDNSLFTNNKVENLTANDGFTGSAGSLSVNGTTAILNTTISNCTIADNIENGTHASLASAGVIATARYNGTLNTNIYNTIFWNNSRLTNVAQANSLGRMNAANFSNTLNFSNNLVPEATASSIDSYGTTVTRSNNIYDTAPNWLTNVPWKYYLYATSPAYNAGDNSKVINETEGDLTGKVRIGEGTVDMGAYEYDSSGSFYRTLTTTAVNGVIVEDIAPTNGTYDDGIAIELTATPATGYQFDGWSGDATGTDNPLNITMDNDKNVTAMFSLLQQTLTTVASNGTIVADVVATNGTYDYGTVIELTATPATGYQFDGWSGDVSGTTNPISITMDADKSVTANFSLIQQTLNIVAVNGNINADVQPTNGTYNYGTVVELTATPATGYQFDGWSGDVSGTTNPISITMDADKSVTAMFSLLQQTLTTVASHGTIVADIAAANGIYDYGTVVELTATPNTGYQFDGWSGDVSGTNNPISITMDADKSVTANFSLIQQTLNIVAVNGNINADVQPTNGTYNYGTVVELTATPATGYQFDGWSGDVSGTTNPISITMDADKSVTAMFSLLQETLTTVASHGAIVANIAATNGIYPYGTVLELTATPDTGYQFDGWSGDVTGTDNPLSITMDADKSVTALFSKIQRILTIVATNGTVTRNLNPVNGTYDDGTAIELTATPDTGYQFDGWDGDASGTTNPLSINMDADKTIIAMFSIDNTASITDDTFNNEIRIYPNPVKNTLNISLATGQTLKNVQVFNLLGEKILEANTITIDVNSILAGIYLLKVENYEGKIAVRKIIKK